MALLGVFLIAIMNVGYYINHTLVGRHRLLIGDALQIENGVTMGHLRLEETLQGEIGADNLQARRHFQLAKKYLAELFAGWDRAGASILATLGNECRQIVVELQEARTALEQLGNERYQGFVDGVAGTATDDRYHTVYAEFSHGICPDCYQREMQKIKDIAFTTQNLSN